jgi:hypothetical protein
MRVLVGGVGIFAFFLVSLISLSEVSMAQNNAPPTKVMIPNPTPRQPDLKQVYGDSPEEQEKQQALSLQNQLRAREIWLESNQILLLAQQLQQEILSGKKSVSMAANAAKAGEIEKLAKSVQQKMKTH